MMTNHVQRNIVKPLLLLDNFNNQLQNYQSKPRSVTNHEDDWFCTTNVYAVCPTMLPSLDSLMS